MSESTATDKAPETDWSRALRILRPESLPVAVMHARPELYRIGVGEQLAQWVTA